MCTRAIGYGGAKTPVVADEHADVSMFLDDGASIRGESLSAAPADQANTSFSFADEIDTVVPKLTAAGKTPAVKHPLSPQRDTTRKRPRRDVTDAQTQAGAAARVPPGAPSRPAAPTVESSSRASSVEPKRLKLGDFSAAASHRRTRLVQESPLRPRTPTVAQRATPALETRPTPRAPTPTPTRMGMPMPASSLVSTPYGRQLEVRAHHAEVAFVMQAAMSYLHGPSYTVPQDPSEPRSETRPPVDRVCAFFAAGPDEPYFDPGRHDGDMARETTSTVRQALMSIDSKEIKPHSGCCYNCLLPQKTALGFHWHMPSGTYRPGTNCYFPGVARPLLAAIYADSHTRIRCRREAADETGDMSIHAVNDFKDFMKWAGEERPRQSNVSHAMYLIRAWGRQKGLLSYATGLEQ